MVKKAEEIDSTKWIGDNLLKLDPVRCFLVAIVA